MRDALTGGFDDPARDAARAFRAVMTAMARPGQIHAIGGVQGPAPLSGAAATVLVTLCDVDTPLHLTGACDTPQVRDWVAFHIGASLVAARDAAFALGTWDALQPVTRFAVGTPEYPDRSATLVVELDALRADGATLRGPGIKDTAQFALPEVPAFQRNAAQFPLGFDTIFTAQSQIAALPRSTRVG